MGLFRKREETPAPDPIVADTATIATVSRLMEEFGNAVGNDAQVRWVLSQISSTAGFGDLRDLARGSHVITRPWRLLAAVAEAARLQYDEVLTCRIQAFAFFFRTQLADRIGPGDFYDFRMERAPAQQQYAIAASALRCRNVDPATVLFENRTGAVTWETARQGAALFAIQAKQDGVAPDQDVIDLAHRVLA